jgi:putative acetyltransferase
MTNVIVRAETPQALEAIREVNRSAFRREDEARLVDALRNSGHARLSLVAEQDGLVVGYILFSDLLIVTPTDSLHVLALAPMAVLADRQRQGIGSLLVQEELRGGRPAIVESLGGASRRRVQSVLIALG